LHKAAAEGHTEVCTFLVQVAKVRPNPYNSVFQTPMDLAIEHDHMDLAENLSTMASRKRTKSADIVELSKKLFSLIKEHGTSNLEKITELVDQGADVTWSNPQMNGQTILHSAADAGDLEVVKYLTGSGDLEVDVEAMDMSGETPLHKSAYHGHTEVCRYLIEEVKVRHNPRNGVFQTPEDLAIENDKTETHDYFSSL